MADLWAITSLWSKIKTNQTEAEANWLEDTNTNTWLWAITSLGSDMFNDAQAPDTTEIPDNSSVSPYWNMVSDTNLQNAELAEQKDISPYSDKVSDINLQNAEQKDTTPTETTIPSEWVVDTKADSWTASVTETKTDTWTDTWVINQSDINTEEEKIKKEEADKLLAFNDMLDKWATKEDIQNYVNENPEMLSNIKMAVKNHFKNASNVEFFNKYNSFSSEQLFDAKNNWEFTIWDDKYALLSPEQRAKFEDYDELQRAKNNLDWEDNDVVDYNKLTLQDYIDEVTVSLTSKTRENVEAITNSSEYKQVVTDLENKQNEINIMNDNIRDIAEDIESLHKWVPASVINWIIADKTKSLTNQKNTLINEYNSKLGTLSNMKENIDIELQLWQIEDANAKFIYQTALDQYNSDRNTMTELALAEFEAQNTALAEDLKHQRTLELEAFKSWLKVEEQNWVYKTDREWKLLYVVNGVSKTVTSSLWEIVFTEENKDKWFKDTTYSSDWVYTTVRTYDSWDSPDYFTHNVDWSSTSAMNIYDTISNIPSTWLTSGEAVNKYIAGLWVSPEIFSVWTTYESKSKYIDNTIQTPKPWDLAIWNNGVSEDWKDFWHIWIITWNVQPNWKVEITDWNADWVNETKSTRMVSIDTIKKSDWGFYSTTSYTEWQKSFLEWFDWKITSTVKDTMKALWLTAEDAYSYKTSAVTADDKVQIQKATEMISSLKGMLWLGRTDRMTSKAIQYVPFFWDNEADFQADFGFLKWQLTLQNLMDLKAWGATFGALSNEELIMIRDSATKLSTNLSNEKWDKEVNILVNIFEEMLMTAGWNIEQPKTDNISDTDILEKYKGVKNTIDLSYLD